MKKRLFSIAIAIIIAALPVLSSCGKGKKMEMRNWQQSDEPWGSVMYDGYSFASSACGIMSTVNAIHYLTGNWMDPLLVADWAHEFKDENGTRAYSGTDGTAWHLFFPNVADEFGKKYGFKLDYYCPEYGSGSAFDERFVNHIKDGGVAVVHVYNHFMAVVDYNEETKQFLLWDNASGPVCGYKRCTDIEGNWWTAEQLEGDNNTPEKLTVNWYCLFSKEKKGLFK